MHSEVRNLYAMCDDPGDQWGSCMAHWFGIAGALYGAGEMFPDEWQYSPGLSAGDCEEFPDSAYAEMLARGDVAPDDLRQAGDVLCRYSSMLRSAGKDY